MSTIPEKLIDEQSVTHLKERFESDLKNDVMITLFSDGGDHDYNIFSKKLLTELSAIDGKIKFEELPLDGDIAKELNISVSPSLMLGRDQGYHILYAGAPAGYETGGFIETILLLSKGDSGLSDQFKEELSYLDQPTTLHSFVTPTCPYCPQSAVLNHKIAIEKKDLVKSICIEASQNNEFAQKFGVSSVPQQNINKDPESKTVGGQPEGAYIDQVLSYGASQYQKLKTDREASEKKAAELIDNPAIPLKITDSNFEEAINKYDTIVVDCWAEWCSPCKMLSPIITALAKDQQGHIVFGKLNTDQNQKISEEYSIRSIPTIMIFKEGVKVGQIVGARPKAALLKEIQSFL